MCERPYALGVNFIIERVMADMSDLLKYACHLHWVAIHDGRMAPSKDFYPVTGRVPNLKS